MKYIAGPCTWHNNDELENDLESLLKIFQNEEFYFKSSWLKDNRSSYNGYRGPGEKGIEVLLKLKEKYNVNICTDFHDAQMINKWGMNFDIIQIPAFLSKQTTILEAAAKTGKLINIKKAQWLKPLEMAGAVDKVKNINKDSKVIVMDRGTYGIHDNLYMDPRHVSEFRENTNADYIGVDLTHPTKNSLNRGNNTLQDAAILGTSYIMSGASVIFMEATNTRDTAKCDGDVMLSIQEVKLLKEVID